MQKNLGRPLIVAPSAVINFCLALALNGIIPQGSLM
jgi:hypothetical protein